METVFCAAGFSAFLTEMLAPLLLCSSIPLGTPPAPMDPALARVAPEQNIFYVSWAGMATPDAKSPNRAERFLADPEIRHMRAEAARRFRLLLKSSLEKSKDSPQLNFDDASLLCELFVAQPSACFISHVTATSNPPQFHGGFVMNVGENRNRVAAMLERSRKLLPGDIEVSKRDGYTEFHNKKIAQVNLRWALCDKHLIFTWGDELPEGVVKRMGGKEPSWFTAIGKDLPVERRAAVLRVDLAALVVAAWAGNDAESRQTVKNFADTHLRAVTLVTGLDHEDFVSHVLVEMDGIAAALLRQQADRPLKLGDMAVIPRDATLALALRVDPNHLATVLRWWAENSAQADNKPGSSASKSDGTKQSVQGVLDTAALVSPPVVSDLLPSADSLADCFKAPKLDLDKQLCDDLAASLDDAWRLYTSPGEGSSIFNSLAGVVRVKDRERLLKLFDRLVAGSPSGKPDAKASKPGGSPPKSWAVRKTRFAEHDVYYLAHAAGESYGVLTWCLVDNELVFSRSPQNVKAYLLREPGRSSLADEPAVAETLHAKSSSKLLCYEDSREMFRLTYPWMQGFVNLYASQASLPSDGIDPMLLPAAPTIAKYLRPAVSTIQIAPKGVHVTLHQSLPNGNLGATLYVVACSLLPANLDTISNSSDVKEPAKPEQAAAPNKSSSPANATPAAAAPFPSKFKPVAYREGPCSMKTALAGPLEKEEGFRYQSIEIEGRSTELKLYKNDIVKLDLGPHFQGAVKLWHCKEDVGVSLWALSFKNVSKERRGYKYQLALLDNTGRLVFCCLAPVYEVARTVAPGEESGFRVDTIDMPRALAETVTSYKLRLYETDPLPEKKK